MNTLFSCSATGVKVSLPLLTAGISREISYLNLAGWLLDEMLLNKTITREESFIFQLEICSVRFAYYETASEGSLLS